MSIYKNFFVINRSNNKKTTKNEKGTHVMFTIFFLPKDTATLSSFIFCLYVDSA